MFSGFTTISTPIRVYRGNQSILFIYVVFSYKSGISWGTVRELGNGMWQLGGSSNPIPDASTSDLNWYSITAYIVRH